MKLPFFVTHCHFGICTPNPSFLIIPSYAQNIGTIGCTEGERKIPENNCVSKEFEILPTEDSLPSPNFLNPDAKIKPPDWLCHGVLQSMQQFSLFLILLNFSQH